LAVEEGVLRVVLAAEGAVVVVRPQREAGFEGAVLGVLVGRGGGEEVPTN
jgi:hypothetical protein